MCHLNVTHQVNGLLWVNSAMPFHYMNRVLDTGKDHPQLCSHWMIQTRIREAKILILTQILMMPTTNMPKFRTEKRPQKTQSHHVGARQASRSRNDGST